MSNSRIIHAILSKDRRILAICLTALLLGLICGGVTLAIGTQLSKGSQQSATPVGQSRSTQSSKTQVSSVRPVAARELMSGQLVDGKSGLIVTLSITNTSDKPQAFLPIHHIFARGSAGQSYVPTPLGGVKNPIKAGALSAGSTVSGELSFVVDSDAADIILFLDTRWNNAPPTIHQLSW